MHKIAVVVLNLEQRFQKEQNVRCEAETEVIVSKTAFFHEGNYLLVNGSEASSLNFALLVIIKRKGFN